MRTGVKQRYEIKGLFISKDKVKKYIDLRSILPLLDGFQKQRYGIESIVLKSDTIFVNFDNGDVMAIYFNKFKYFSDSLESINSIVDGGDGFISINGKEFYILGRYYSDIYFSVFDNTENTKIN